MQQDGAMHVLIAPDAFPPHIGARRAGEALAAGWSRGAPHDSIDVCALSDGGAELVELVAGSVGLRPAPGGVLRVPGTNGASTAYIDARRCIDRDRSSSSLAARLEQSVRDGATRIVVGLPSAEDEPWPPDAGAELLRDLGALDLGALDDTALDDTALAAGRSSEGPRTLAGLLGSVRASDLDGLVGVRERLRRVDIVGAFASDVPLLGLHGASARAAATDAVTPDEAQALERAIGHFAHVVSAVVTGIGPRRPLLLASHRDGQDGRGTGRALTSGAGTGAGAGLGFALAVLGGRLVNGADVFASVARVSERAQSADLVLTGRGALDGASFHGSPVAVAVRAAGEWGLPCLAVAGTSLMSRREESSVGLHALTTLAPEADGPGETERALVDCADRLARSWSPARVFGHT